MTDRTEAIDGFLEDIASERVTPAGGTATAVVGAVGAALCEMVCLHADGDGAEGAAALAEAREDLRSQRSHLLTLAEADADLLDELFPGSDGPPEQSLRKRSIGIPLTTAKSCLTVVELAAVVTANARGEAVADGAMGAMHAHAALGASVFTVRYNLAEISDPKFADSVAARANELESAGGDAVQRVLDSVDS